MFSWRTKACLNVSTLLKLAETIWSIVLNVSAVRLHDELGMVV